ncbi:MAG: 4-hydroxythreonine-4-phosphate dehydrogenase [Osedax symbiont Rs1]|nr:MAG: 4-hydroxythreonine-4-phosphate dehydrogenase [Osedax symbiont Rs1]
MKAKIGIILGDPSGIGPEIVARLLADTELSKMADILLIGDRHLIERGKKIAGVDFSYQQVDANNQQWQDVDGIAWHPTHAIPEADVVTAKVGRDSGKYVFQTLDIALDFARQGIIQAIVFGPFNKSSLHLAGLKHPDELHYIGEYLAVDNYISELNTIDNYWTSRVTSHIALRDVADSINGHRIAEAVKLLDTTLKHSGVKQPRLAVAALNPHAGDNGNFGREEIDTIGPAVQQLNGSDLQVTGPWPSDTVFLKMIAGEIDAVVTMYHDQGQIALKLLGFDRGVTVQGGIPFPITTPAHGTAFDIAGRGKADVGAIAAAFSLACNMVNNWQH